MTTGRLARPSRHFDIYEGTTDTRINNAEARRDLRYQRVVFTRIALRQPDDADLILEALGLIPTVRKPVPVPEPAASQTCGVCGWVTVQGDRRPVLALARHARIHKGETA